MNVLVLQVFVSLMLVASSVLLFAYSVRHRDHEHADRLSLFPLEDDSASPSDTAAAASTLASPPSAPEPPSPASASQE